MKLVREAHPDTLEPAPAWSTNALCATPQYAGQHDLWYPKPSDEKAIRKAKQLCWDCPAIAACAQHALENREPFGVWGGVDEKERRAILRRRGVRIKEIGSDEEQPEPDTKPRNKGGRPLAPCGTRSAYQRHVKRGEPVDEACRAAASRADNRLRRTGTTKVAA